MGIQIFILVLLTHILFSKKMKLISTLAIAGLAFVAAVSAKPADATSGGAAAEQQTADQKADETADQNADKNADKNDDKSADKNEDKAADKSEDKTGEPTADTDKTATASSSTLS